MIILLGSKNPNKKKSLEKALEKLQITEYEIIPYDANSNVSDRPIGSEITKGADNRNQNLKKYAKENNIIYDYLCSIEGGFILNEEGIPFIITYCVIEDIQEQKSIGNSIGLQLSQTMFDYIKKGNSLNKVIESIILDENNKQKQGITGYLSKNIYNREIVDCDAIVSAFIPFIYKEQRDILDKQILTIIKKK